MQTEAQVTLATPANMRAFEERNPSRTVQCNDGPAIIEGRRCFALSPLTGEEASASSGDYWQHADNEPLLDSEGEPMILAVRRTVYVDAFTGEQV